MTGMRGKRRFGTGHEVIVILVLCLALTGCASSNVIFATRSSVGLDVSGTATDVPNHVSFAYDREELVYVPPGMPHDTSVLGTLDSQFTWTRGAAISERFATGEAAILAAKILNLGGPLDRSPNDAPEDPTLKASPRASTPSEATCASPLLVLTGTRFGLCVDLGQANANAVSLLTGYKRYNLAVIPRKPNSESIHSVYGDITIHHSGFARTVDPSSNPTFAGRTLYKDDRTEGVRIVQHIATGNAADELLKSDPGKARRLVPPDENAVGSTLAHYEQLSPEGKKRFVAALSDIDKRPESESTGTELEIRLSKLSDQDKERMRKLAEELPKRETPQ
ncbi:MAG: hypothetical protein AB9873_04895 [Syntrophobacteraceae bacterium]